MGKIMRNGKKYSGASSSMAENIVYDNTESGLEASDVQGAVDELNSKVDDLNSNFDEQNKNISDINSTVGTLSNNVIIGEYELLLKKGASGTYTIKNLSNYKAIFCMVKVGDHYYEPYYIPIKIFKAITADASYGFMCEYGTGVYIGIKYVSNTSVKLTVSGTLTMYVYGIK